MPSFAKVGRGFIAVVALWVLAAVGLAGYASLDESGWIVHNHDTPVWVQGDWLVGEYRDCKMLTTTPFVEGVNYSSEELAHLPRLYCNSGANGSFEGVDASWAGVSKDFHVLPVKYFGRLERPNKWLVSWRCQRKSESLTCWALD